MSASSSASVEDLLSQAEVQQLVTLQEGRPAAPPDASAEPDFPPSAERVAQEVEEVLHKPLSPEFTRWVQAYAQVGRRPPYLWNWCRQAVEVITLPCTVPERRAELCDTKTLGVMLDVMLDDLADQGGNRDLLEALLGMVTETRAGRPVGLTSELASFSPEEREYGRFTVELWQEIQRRARRYPRFAEFDDLLRYDYLQLVNVMRYSYLLNESPELLNLTEHDLYTPHNMHIMICSTFDLMCSPGFDRSELGLLREIMWAAQSMGRIGNLVTTWQRELREGDFTSGVYARAVSAGDLSVRQLMSAEPTEVEAVIAEGNHERHFLDRWRAHREFLGSQRGRLKSFDVARLIEGLERLICLHLGSRGRK